MWHATPKGCLPNYRITNYTVCIETLQVWKGKERIAWGSEEEREGLQVGVRRSERGRQGDGVAAGIVAGVNSMNN